MNLLERLKATSQINNSPYAHLLFDNLLLASDALQIQGLAVDIPEKYMTTFNPGYEDSYENENIYCLNTYRRKENTPLSSLLNELASDEVVTWMLKQFGLDHVQKPKVDLNLHREFSGFIGLTPHTDMLNSQNRKVLNWFFYLSDNRDCPSHYGTKLLPGDAQNYAEEQSMLISYQANRALAFAITENSWHMVDALHEDCKRRDVLVMRVIA